MNSNAIFWLQILSSTVAFIVLAAWYAWPSLRKMPRNSALIAMLFVHVPRYVGMVLLVPHMVDANLPEDFRSDTAYGDLIEAGLALVSIVALRGRWGLALPLVWITNIWGFVDLLNGLRSVIQLNVPGFDLDTLWYIYTFYAPIVAISHILIFWTLIRTKSWKN